MTDGPGGARRLLWRKFSEWEARGRHIWDALFIFNIWNLIEPLSRPAKTCLDPMNFANNISCLTFACLVFTCYAMPITIGDLTCSENMNEVLIQYQSRLYFFICVATESYRNVDLNIFASTLVSFPGDRNITVKKPLRHKTEKIRSYQRKPHVIVFSTSLRIEY